MQPDSWTYARLQRALGGEERLAQELFVQPDSWTYARLQRALGGEERLAQELFVQADRRTYTRLRRAPPPLSAAAERGGGWGVRRG